jgi:uncharacterized damage-inducible protein DinB
MLQAEPGDTSVLEWLFRHNTWANLTLLEFCEGLSDAELDAAAVGGYGSIRDTFTHYVYAEVDYVNLANDKWPEAFPREEQFVGVAGMKAAMRWAGDELLQLALAARADTIVHVERPDEPVYEYPLAGFMVQVLDHSAEHRTQIATILTQIGLEPPPVSGWKYMRARGDLHEFA